MAISTNAQNVLNSARQISQEPDPAIRAPNIDLFVTALGALTPDEVMQVIANLASYDFNPGAVSKSLREAAIAAAATKNANTLDAAVTKLAQDSNKNAADIVTATKNFDRKAAVLTLWLIILAFVGAFLSLVGILVAIIPESAKDHIWHTITGFLHGQ